MKLTNYLRDAFINAAMQDVPQTDYREQIQKLMQDDFDSQLPKEVLAMSKKFPGYFSTGDPLRLGNGLGYVYARIWIRGEMPTLTKAGKDAQQKLLDADLLQQKNLNVLKEKLHNVAYGCSTTNALATALPEFQKYLPTEPAKATSLPALANVVSDFVKAGWPKDAKKEPA